MIMQSSIISTNGAEPPRCNGVIRAIAQEVQSTLQLPETPGINTSHPWVAAAAYSRLTYLAFLALLPSKVAAISPQELSLLVEKLQTQNDTEERTVKGGVCEWPVR